MSANVGVNGSQIFDQGLQPERTALAWRRTGLALVVASLVALRVLPHALGAWAFAPAAAGLALALLVLVLAHRRDRQVQRVLLTSDTDRVPLPSAGLPLLVVLTVMGGGLAALALVIVPLLR